MNRNINVQLESSEYPTHKRYPHHQSGHLRPPADKLDYAYKSVQLVNSSQVDIVVFAFCPDQSTLRPPEVQYVQYILMSTRGLYGTCRG